MNRRDADERISGVVEVHPVDVTFAGVLARQDLSGETRRSLKGANVLVIPQEGIHEGVDLSFPSGTEDFIRFLREQYDSGAKADIAIDDERYQEFAKHGALVEVAQVLAAAMVAHAVVGFMDAWIRRRLGRKHSREDVKAELIVATADKSVLLRYEGPATQFARAMTQAVENVLHEKDVNLG